MTAGSDRRADAEDVEPGARLGDFLRARRALVDPPRHGGGRRRVPGLRREEVAALARVSTDYYTRLEQGRHRRPSDSVLAALAGALELDDLATRHLFDLARSVPVSARGTVPEPVQRVRPSLHLLLESFTEHPAFIRGRRTEVLAMNRLAAALLADLPARPARERALVRWAFLDPQARQRYVDWEAVASSMVGTLRLDAGRHPGDPLLDRLVAELTAGSAEFRDWWADHRIAERRDGTKRLDHPVVGRVDVRYEALEVTGVEDQTMFVYTTDPGSDSQAALHRLAGLVAADRAPVVSPRAGQAET